MKYKKILAITLIAVLAVVLIGAASAAESGNKTNIRGFDFNIPSGYEEMKDISVRNNTTSEGNVSVTTDMIFYTDGSDIACIMVLEFNSNISDSLINDDGEKTTLKNITGVMCNGTTGDYIFKYIKGNSLIEVSSENKTIIEEMLV